MADRLLYGRQAPILASRLLFLHAGSYFCRQAPIPLDRLLSRCCRTTLPTDEHARKGRLAWGRIRSPPRERVRASRSNRTTAWTWAGLFALKIFFLIFSSIRKQSLLWRLRGMFTTGLLSHDGSIHLSFNLNDLLKDLLLVWFLLVSVKESAVPG